MGDVEGAQVAFDVHEGAHPADVVAAGDVTEFSGLVLIPGADLALLKVISDGISLIDFRVGESNCPGVVGDNVGDLVWANCFSFDLAKFELGFGVLDREEGESSLNVIEHTIVLIGLHNRNHIHNSNWELGITSDLVVDFEASLLVHSHEGDLAGIKSET